MRAVFAFEALLFVAAAMLALRGCSAGSPAIAFGVAPRHTARRADCKCTAMP